VPRFPFTLIDNQPSNWDGLLAGLQLAIFEILWPKLEMLRTELTDLGYEVDWLKPT
jgi:hypothetical protein